jgi:hypothetical protein
MLHGQFIHLHPYADSLSLSTSRVHIHAEATSMYVYPYLFLYWFGTKFDSGDEDSVVPLIGTRTLIGELAKDLRLKTSIPYSAWYENHQVCIYSCLCEMG